MEQGAGREWPWTDADPDDPLTARRIPVTGAHPDWAYVVAFDRRSPDRPGEAEATALESYAAYAALHRLTAWDRKLYAGRPFDMGDGNATLVLRKRGPGDWTYRSTLWPATAPWARFGGQPMPLTAVLDHNEGGAPAWADWKARHHDEFAARQE